MRMPLPPDLQVVDGAQELYDWFGYWPSFHDFEVISLHLNRTGSSFLVVHAWETTKDVDKKGCFVHAKHVLVQVILDDLSDLALDDFSCQNVLSFLDIKKSDAGFILTLGPCYGLAGTIEAKTIHFQLTPGVPPDRQF